MDVKLVPLQNDKDFFNTHYKRKKEKKKQTNPPTPPQTCHETTNKMSHRDFSFEDTGSGLLRLFGADAAQPGAAGEDGSAALTHFVLAHSALIGENAQNAHGLQAPATAALTVFAAATFGTFPLHVQQLQLQLSGSNREKKALMTPEGNVNRQNCVYFHMFFNSSN